LLPLVPPREFEPTLLLGVALGITAVRVGRAIRVQDYAARIAEVTKLPAERGFVSAACELIKRT
jgi:hypothetical protein